MEIKVIGYDHLIGLESVLKNHSNTSFKFYDLGDLHRRLNTQSIHPITLKLKESGLVKANRLPVDTHAQKLVNECINR